MYDIVIIGAGVVGGMIAETLSRYNVRVCILEKAGDVAMGATKANSAIVHGGFDPVVGSLKARMNKRGSELMPEVCARLGVKYNNNQALVVGFENERAEVEELYRNGIANGIKGLRIVEREELHTLEKNLNPKLSCALLSETSAIVCPYELCIAAVGNAMDNGVELMLDYEVTDVEKTPDGYAITSSDERVVNAKYIINSAGVYSDEIAEMTGDCDFKITPRRGEYMVLDKECGDFVQRTIFHTPTKMGKGILITPTVDGNLLVGPTAVNIEEKDNYATTIEGFATLFAKSEENVSNLPFNKVITSFCGLRSVGDKGDFIIKERDGVITLGGIESPGLTSAPAIAEYVEEMLTNMGAISQKNENYIGTRKPIHYFNDLSEEEKNAIIKEHPEYGRIVCRCEGITEGEIIEAVHRNPAARDVDGIKRRTRSGMGRCQGGFCSPIVVSIIARELGVPFEGVTKSGSDSIINYGKTKGDN